MTSFLGRTCFARVAAYGLFISLSPAVVSGECPFYTLSQAMADPMNSVVFNGTAREVRVNRRRFVISTIISPDLCLRLPTFSPVLLHPV